MELDKDAPFESFRDLRADHSRLLKAKAAKGPAAKGPSSEEVSLFLARARATGRKLDATSQREAAQSAIDYWTATLYAMSGGATVGTAAPPVRAGGTPDMHSMLEPFDTATVKKVADDAEAWFAGLSPENQASARRALMRMVVLPADAKAFASSPVSRASLDSFGTPELIDAGLAKLEAMQILRLTPGDAPGTALVGLRFEALMREWPRMAGWLNQRLRFREAVRFWEANAFAPSALIRDDLLDEAREYHDLDPLEQQFVATSGKRAREQDRIDRHWHNWRFWLAVALAGVFALGAFQFWRARSWEQAKRQAETAKKEIVTMQMVGLIADGLADSISMSVLIELLTKHDAHYAKKLLIVQILGQMVSAPSEDAWVAAKETWTVFEIDLKDDPAPDDSFWFKNDFFPGKAEESVPTTNQARIALLTKNRRQSHDHRIELYWISKDLKPWLGPKIPNGVKGRWYAVARSTADALAKAARDGRTFEEVAAFEGLFWRLYLGEMVLVEGEAVEGKMVRFGHLLQEWEKRGGDAKAPAELAEKMQRAAVELKTACELDTNGDRAR